MKQLILDRIDTKWLNDKYFIYIGDRKIGEGKLSDIELNRIKSNWRERTTGEKACDWFIESEVTRINDKLSDLSNDNK